MVERGPLFLLPLYLCHLRVCPLHRRRFRPLHCCRANQPHRHYAQHLVCVIFNSIGGGF